MFVVPQLNDKSIIKIFGRWTRILFLIASLIAVAVTLISFTGAGPLGPESNTIFWLLIFNFLLIAVLAINVLRNYFQLRSKSPEKGTGRLATQFATLFSFAAIAPALLFSVFLGSSLNKAIDNWFSERVEAVVEGAAAVSRSNLESVGDDIRLDTGIMAMDLNRAVIGFETEPDVFAQFMREQAAFRDFTGALILSSEGDILLASDPVSQRKYERPTQDMFDTANQGDVSVLLSDETLQFWALYKLSDFDNAYLYTVRPIDSPLLGSLRNAEQTLNVYRKAEEQSRQLQIIFLLGFSQITALILLFFVQYGVWAAGLISNPILKLAKAADQVRHGDLSVQVSLPEQNNEVAELTTSFNAMTSQLRQQHEAIDIASREAIERSEFIEAVLQGVSAGVVRVDDHLRVTLANPSAIGIFAILETPGDVFLGQFSPEISDLAMKAMADKESKSANIILNTDQSYRHLLVRAVPSHEDELGCILTFDDTTRLISAQRQTAWRDVARRVAHEIRNPLTPIQLSAERLRRRYRKSIDEEDQVFDRCIDTIFRQVSDIGRMVEEFSTFARMPKPEVKAFDLIEQVRECVFAARLSKPNIEYDYQTNQKEIQIFGDSRLLSQALTNLLKNAGEAVERSLEEDDESESRTPSVTTDIQVTDDHVILDIEDTGPGFPKTNRHHFLEPYYTTREQGVGLGLAIVNRIVEDHGGQLTLLDRRDEMSGARVCIQLPLSGPSDETVESWTLSEEQA